MLELGQSGHAPSLDLHSESKAHVELLTTRVTLDRNANLGHGVSCEIWCLLDCVNGRPARRYVAEEKMQWLAECMLKTASG